MINNVLKAVRPHMWSKNSLVFVALFLSHQYGEMDKVIAAFICFIAFSLVASSSYLINDLFDIEADKTHPYNKSRPITAGKISKFQALGVSTILLVLGLGLSSLVSLDLVKLLMLYFILTCSYSYHLKKIVLLDTIILGFLFTLRIFAGGIAAEIEISSWLLTFSIFFFYSLALLKRSVEIKERQSIDGKIPNRGYKTDDYLFIHIVGIISAYISCIIFSFYLITSAAKEYYSQILPLWFICPILIYWIGKIWLSGFRGEIKTDPVLFVIKSKENYFICLAVIAILLYAR